MLVLQQSWYCNNPGKISAQDDEISFEMGQLRAEQDATRGSTCPGIKGFSKNQPPGKP